MANDLISRKALLERLEKIYGTNSIVDKIMLRFLKKLIRKQPTVDRWIPCSERLPEDREEKLIYLSSNRTTIARYNEHILPHSGMPVGWGFRPNNGYIDFETETVIAWQPLPEPYKAGDIDG